MESAKTPPITDACTIQCISVNPTYLLSITRFSILSLSPVYKSRSFSVEAMQTIGLLVDESIILGHKLPADFRRVDGRSSGHDESEPAFPRSDELLVNAKL